MSEPPVDQNPSKGINRIFRRVEGLDDVTRAMIYLAVVILAIAAVIVAVVFRTTLLRLVIWTIAIVAVAGCGISALYIARARRTKREVAAEIESRRATAEFQRHEAEQFERAEKRAKLLHEISEGRVPPITDPGDLFLRNSETPWYRTRAYLDHRGDDHPGELVVTSLRLAFVSTSSPVDLPIANVNAANISGDCLTVIGKSANQSIRLFMDDPHIAKAHIERSVKAFHRQVDVGFQAGANRGVPQDVKTAVYQRDQGRCVECSAEDYLEFDHVIPFSKGGASTVDNIQLLCRRCNNKKRDSI